MMDSVSESSSSHWTFLSAPDDREIPTLDPVGIRGAQKFLDFDSMEDEEDGDEKSVRVYARVKPLGPESSSDSSSPFTVSEREVTTSSCYSAPSQRFLFSRIFGEEVHQKEFFSRMVLPRLKAFLRGSNQLLFTYGTSSSGKTFTVQGSPSQPGILPRSLDVIFNSLIQERLLDEGPLKPAGFDALARHKESLKEEKSSVLALGSYLSLEVPSSSRDTHSHIGLENLSQREKESSRVGDVLDEPGLFYSIWVSFAEIYNENIYDLFESLPKKLRSSTRKRPLKLCEDRKGSAYIKGLKEISVSSADEAYRLLLIGRKNLQFAATKLNHNSSRSHCIFTVKLICFCNAEAPQMGRVHVLSFCDLAGSERMKKTNNVGTRKLEAGNINTSLLVLGRVMKNLRDNQRLKDPKKHAMVPFRDSKLTRLFQAFFTGYGKASMIVNLTQSPNLFDETLQALKFAAITSKIHYAKEQPPTKPKRKSHFSSILFQHKRSSVFTGRNTILWENPNARSTMCPPGGQEEDEEKEESEEESELENSTQYEALNALITDLQQRLAAEKHRNINLESDIRTELCKEFNVMMVRVENEWQERLKVTTERMDELSDWRIQKLENAYKSNRKRKCFEMGASEMDQVSELKDKLEQREEELETNKRQLQAIKDTHKSLLDARNKLQEELTALRFTNEDQKGKLISMGEEIKKLSLESKSKDSAIESLSSNPIIKDLKSQLWDIRDKLTEKTEEMVFLKKLLDEAGEEFLAKDDNEKKLKVEIMALKTELESIKLTLGDTQEENNVLLKDSNSRQEEMESLEELLAGSRNENAKLSAELSKIKGEASAEDFVEESVVSEISSLRQRLDSTSEEVDGLLRELNRTRKLHEDSEKSLRRAEEERSRLEKDLNDEIEALRSSNVKIKSSDDEKNKKLREKEHEIHNLEKEIKCLLRNGSSTKQQCQGDDKDKELHRLREEVGDSQVLGKKIAEQHVLIQSLESQVKSFRQEEDVINILKNELKLRNSEKAGLTEKIARLEEEAGKLSQLSKTQETVSYLESEIEAKNYEIKKTQDEKESVLIRYNKLIKVKEEELTREKTEALKLRDVMRSATPKKSSKSINNSISKCQLQEEILKKDEAIRELELRLQKSLCDGEVEDLLRDEIESLKRSMSEYQESHKQEMCKIKKANDKIINEYKEANKELQKQVGISSSSSNGFEEDEPSQEAPHGQEEGESPSYNTMTTTVSMERQSVKKRSRRPRNKELSGCEEEEEESLLQDTENAGEVTRKSTRVTRSRPVHKTKKKHVSYVERTAKTEKRLNDSEISNRLDESIETPRRSKRNPISNSGIIDALSPIENLNGSWGDASRSAGRRQLRTRKKK